MNPTIDDFLVIFSEFDDDSIYAFAKVEYFFNQSLLQVGKNAFRKNYAHAVYLLTAHNLIMNDSSRVNDGQIKSEKAGDLSTTYVTEAGEGQDQYLRQTNYGLQYIELRDSTIISINIAD